MRNNQGIKAPSSADIHDSAILEGEITLGENCRNGVST